MINLIDLFQNEITSQVYYLNDSTKSEDISKFIRARKFKQFVLDGSHISNKGEFIQHFGLVTQPPNIFFDWDYLERQLELTDWLDYEKGVIFNYRNAEHFFKINRKEFNVLIDIFFSVTHFRNQKRIKPLIIFLEADTHMKAILPLKQVSLL